MESSDGYLDRFTKKHKTNNLILRWFANLCEIPAHYHLMKFLKYSNLKDYGVFSRLHAFMAYWLYKPYLKWGTAYELKTNKDYQ